MADFDLPSAVLSGSSDLGKKRCIAQVARLVLDASAADLEAKRIADRAASDLVHLLDPVSV